MAITDDVTWSHSSTQKNKCLHPGTQIISQILRVGKAIEVNTILYYQVSHITYNFLLYLSHFKPIHQLVKKVKIVEVGPRDGLQNEKVCETVWLCKNKKEGPETEELNKCLLRQVGTFLELLIWREVFL